MRDKLEDKARLETQLLNIGRETEDKCRNTYAQSGRFENWGKVKKHCQILRNCKTHGKGKYFNSCKTLKDRMKKRKGPNATESDDVWANRVENLWKIA